MRRIVAYVQLVLSLVALLVVVVLAVLHPQKSAGPVILVSILLIVSMILSVVKLRYLRNEGLETRPDSH